MDGPQRTRSCTRQPRSPVQGAPRGSKQICIPMTRDLYDRIWNDAGEVRRFLGPLIEAMPELFPAGIQDGYQLTRTADRPSQLTRTADRPSQLSGHLPKSAKMPDIRLRQLRVQNRVYSLRPSFVLSYMTGTVEKLEHPLLLLSYGVPCWLLTKIFGHNDMFWQRHLERLGRNSLVGTTVRVAERLPVHLAADEHHADWGGEKGFVAVTAGGGCLLGMALTDVADEPHLTQAYGQFAAEAREVQPDYTPQTVNTDGWFATQNTFLALFPTIAVVLCFLHGFLKVRKSLKRQKDEG